MKLSRQVYTVEFKEEAVKRVKSGERIASVDTGRVSEFL